MDSRCQFINRSVAVIPVGAGLQNPVVELKKTHNRPRPRLVLILTFIVLVCWHPVSQGFQEKNREKIKFKFQKLNFIEVDHHALLPIKLL